MSKGDGGGDELSDEISELLDASDGVTRRDVLSTIGGLSLAAGAGTGMNSLTSNDLSSQLADGVKGRERGLNWGAAYHTTSYFNSTGTVPENPEVDITAEPTVNTHAALTSQTSLELTDALWRPRGNPNYNNPNRGCWQYTFLLKTNALCVATNRDDEPVFPLPFHILESFEVKSMGDTDAQAIGARRDRDQFGSVSPESILELAPYAATDDSASSEFYPTMSANSDVWDSLTRMHQWDSTVPDNSSAPDVSSSDDPLIGNMESLYGLGLLNNEAARLRAQDRQEFESVATGTAIGALALMASIPTGAYWIPLALGAMGTAYSATDFLDELSDTVPSPLPNYRGFTYARADTEETAGPAAMSYVLFDVYVDPLANSAFQVRSRIDGKDPLATGTYRQSEVSWEIEISPNGNPLNDDNEPPERPVYDHEMALEALGISREDSYVEPGAWSDGESSTEIDSSPRPKPVIWCPEYVSKGEKFALDAYNTKRVNGIIGGFSFEWKLYRRTNGQSTELEHVASGEGWQFELDGLDTPGEYIAELSLVDEGYNSERVIPNRSVRTRASFTVEQHALADVSLASPLHRDPLTGEDISFDLILRSHEDIHNLRTWRLEFSDGKTFRGANGDFRPVSEADSAALFHEVRRGPFTDPGTKTATLTIESREYGEFSRTFEFTVRPTPASLEYLSEPSTVDVDDVRNEQIFLKNAADGPLDIGGWTLTDADETASVTFDQGTTIPADGEFSVSTLDPDSEPPRDVDAAHFLRSDEPVWDPDGDYVVVSIPGTDRVTTLPVGDQGRVDDVEAVVTTGPEGASEPRSETVTVRNASDSVIQLGGWVVSDRSLDEYESETEAKRHSYRFDETALRPDRTVILHTGSGEDTDDPSVPVVNRYWGRSEQFWTGGTGEVHLTPDPESLTPDEVNDEAVFTYGDGDSPDGGSGTTIEDFESGDLSAWTWYETGASGSGSYSVTSADPYEGEYALEYNGDRNTFAVSTGEDLPYPSRGDAFELRWKYPSSPPGNGGFGWAVQNEDFDGGYRVDLRNDNWSTYADTATLYRRDAGDETVLDQVDLGPSAHGDQYLRWTVDWGETITVTGYTSDGEAFVTLSAEDSTYESGGILCSSNCPDPGTIYFDEWRYVTDGSDEPPARELPFVEDFEDGTLERWETVDLEDDGHNGTYEITTDPARGEYAVSHQTESQYLKPADDLALEPPLEFTYDVYIDGMSGVDAILQYDPDTKLAYKIKAHQNYNGDVFEIEKQRRPFSENTETLSDERIESAGFEDGTWETIRITWTEDGTITAAVESSGAQVQLTDTELTDNPFRVVGYNYEGSAAFDNVEIRSLEDAGGGNVDAELSVQTTDLVEGEPVSFEVANRNETAVVEGWTLEFGDGETTSGDGRILGGGSTVDHRYREIGADAETFTATLTMTGENGAESSDSAEVTVEDNGSPGDGSDDVEAEIELLTDDVVEHDRIEFRISNPDDDAVATSWSVDWGDAMSDGAEDLRGIGDDGSTTIEHRYELLNDTAKEFTVTLDVYNGGSSATDSVSFTVEPAYAGTLGADQLVLTADEGNTRSGDYFVDHVVVEGETVEDFEVGVEAWNGTVEGDSHWTADDGSTLSGSQAGHFVFANEGTEGESDALLTREMGATDASGEYSFWAREAEPADTDVVFGWGNHRGMHRHLFGFNLSPDPWIGDAIQLSTNGIGGGSVDTGVELGDEWTKLTIYAVDWDGIHMEEGKGQGEYRIERPAAETPSPSADLEEIDSGSFTFGLPGATSGDLYATLDTVTDRPVTGEPVEFEVTNRNGEVPLTEWLVESTRTGETVGRGDGSSIGDGAGSTTFEYTFGDVSGSAETFDLRLVAKSANDELHVTEEITVKSALDEVDQIFVGADSETGSGAYYLDRFRSGDAVVESFRNGAWNWMGSVDAGDLSVTTERAVDDDAGGHLRLEVGESATGGRLTRTFEPPAESETYAFEAAAADSPADALRVGWGSSDAVDAQLFAFDLRNAATGTVHLETNADAIDTGVSLGSDWYRFEVTAVDWTVGTGEYRILESDGDDATLASGTFEFEPESEVVTSTASSTDAPTSASSEKSTGGLSSSAGSGTPTSTGEAVSTGTSTATPDSSESIAERVDDAIDDLLDQFF